MEETNCTLCNNTGMVYVEDAFGGGSRAPQDDDWYTVSNDRLKEMSKRMNEVN